MAFTLSFTPMWEVVTLIKVSHKPDLVHNIRGLAYTPVLSEASGFTPCAVSHMDFINPYVLCCCRVHHPLPPPVDEKYKLIRQS